MRLAPVLLKETQEDRITGRPYLRMELFGGPAPACLDRRPVGNRRPSGGP